jgi:hypothetical protein
MMNEHVGELIESLDALLSDLRRAGCHLVTVLVEPGDTVGYHSWYGGNPAMLYGLLQAVEQQVYDTLIDTVRGETDDDTE